MLQSANSLIYATCSHGISVDISEPRDTPACISSVCLWHNSCPRSALFLMLLCTPASPHCGTVKRGQEQSQEEVWNQAEEVSAFLDPSYQCPQLVDVDVDVDMGLRHRRPSPGFCCVKRYQRYRSVLADSMRTMISYMS